MPTQDLTLAYVASISCSRCGTFTTQAEGMTAETVLQLHEGHLDSVLVELCIIGAGEYLGTTLTFQLEPPGPHCNWIV